MILLLLTAFGISLVATTNVDCGGKPFHCVNSTHFMICVDLGGGVSMTVEDFVIKCPSSTVCLDTNLFECEFPVASTEAIPQPSDVINEVQTVANTMMWEDVNVENVIPPNKTIETERLLTNSSSDSGVNKGQGLDTKRNLYMNIKDTYTTGPTESSKTSVLEDSLNTTTNKTPEVAFNTEIFDLNLFKVTTTMAGPIVSELKNNPVIKKLNNDDEKPKPSSVYLAEYDLGITKDQTNLTDQLLQTTAATVNTNLQVSETYTQYPKNSVSENTTEHTSYNTNTEYNEIINTMEFTTTGSSATVIATNATIFTMSTDSTLTTDASSFINLSKPNETIFNNSRDMHFWDTVDENSTTDKLMLTTNTLINSSVPNKKEEYIVQKPNDNNLSESTAYVINNSINNFTNFIHDLVSTVGSIYNSSTYATSQRTIVTTSPTLIGIKNETQNNPNPINIIRNIKDTVNIPEVSSGITEKILNDVQPTTKNTDYTESLVSEGHTEAKSETSASNETVTSSSVVNEETNYTDNNEKTLQPIFTTSTETSLTNTDLLHRNYDKNRKILNETTPNHLSNTIALVTMQDTKSAMKKSKSSITDFDFIKRNSSSKSLTTSTDESAVEDYSINGSTTEIPILYDADTALTAIEDKSTLKNTSDNKNLFFTEEHSVSLNTGFIENHVIKSETDSLSINLTSTETPIKSSASTDANIGFYENQEIPKTLETSVSVDHELNNNTEVLTHTQKPAIDINVLYIPTTLDLNILTSKQNIRNPLENVTFNNSASVDNAEADTVNAKTETLTMTLPRTETPSYIFVTEENLWKNAGVTDEVQISNNSQIATVSSSTFSSVETSFITPVMEKNITSNVTEISAGDFVNTKNKTTKIDNIFTTTSTESNNILNISEVNSQKILNTNKGILETATDKENIFFVGLSTTENTFVQTENNWNKETKTYADTNKYYSARDASIIQQVTDKRSSTAAKNLDGKTQYNLFETTTAFHSRNTEQPEMNTHREKVLVTSIPEILYKKSSDYSTDSVSIDGKFTISKQNTVEAEPVVNNDFSYVNTQNSENKGLIQTIVNTVSTDTPLVVNTKTLPKNMIVLSKGEMFGTTEFSIITTVNPGKEIQINAPLTHSLSIQDDKMMVIPSNTEESTNKSVKSAIVIETYTKDSEKGSQQVSVKLNISESNKNTGTFYTTPVTNVGVQNTSRTKVSNPGALETKQEITSNTASSQNVDIIAQDNSSNKYWETYMAPTDKPIVHRDLNKTKNIDHTTTDKTSEYSQTKYNISQRVKINKTDNNNNQKSIKMTDDISLPFVKDPNNSSTVNKLINLNINATDSLAIINESKKDEKKSPNENTTILQLKTGTVNNEQGGAAKPIEITINMTNDYDEPKTSSKTSSTVPLINYSTQVDITDVNNKDTEPVKRKLHEAEGLINKSNITERTYKAQNRTLTHSDNTSSKFQTPNLSEINSTVSTDKDIGSVPPQTIQYNTVDEDGAKLTGTSKTDSEVTLPSANQSLHSGADQLQNVTITTAAKESLPNMQLSAVTTSTDQYDTLHTDLERISSLPTTATATILSPSIVKLVPVTSSTHLTDQERLPSINSTARKTTQSSDQYSTPKTKSVILKIIATPSSSTKSFKEVVIAAGEDQNSFLNTDSIKSSSATIIKMPILVAEATSQPHQNKTITDETETESRVLNSTVNDTDTDLTSFMNESLHSQFRLSNVTTITKPSLPNKEFAAVTTTTYRYDTINTKPASKLGLSTPVTTTLSRPPIEEFVPVTPFINQVDQGGLPNIKTTPEITTQSSKQYSALNEVPLKLPIITTKSIKLPILTTISIPTKLFKVDATSEDQYSSKNIDVIKYSSATTKKMTMISTEAPSQFYQAKNNAEASKSDSKVSLSRVNETDTSLTSSTNQLPYSMSERLPNIAKTTTTMFTNLQFPTSTAITDNYDTESGRILSLPITATTILRPPIEDFVSDNPANKVYLGELPRKDTISKITTQSSGQSSHSTRNPEPAKLPIITTTSRLTKPFNEAVAAISEDQYGSKNTDFLKSSSATIKEIPIIITETPSQTLHITAEAKIKYMPDSQKQLASTESTSQSQNNSENPKEPEFDCSSRPIGRYAYEHDCRKFYICGSINTDAQTKPIVGYCPMDTVFSNIKKQCTRNLSHCVRNGQFICTKAGRFSDFFKENIYYICVKNSHDTFVRFKFQCQNGYHLNRTPVKCVQDTERITQALILTKSSNQSQTTVYETSGNKSEGASTPDNEEEKRGDEDFKCEEEGKFADPDDCRIYYQCIKYKKSNFLLKKEMCDDDEVFHQGKNECVDTESYDS